MYKYYIIKKHLFKATDSASLGRSCTEQTMLQEMKPVCVLLLENDPQVGFGQQPGGGEFGEELGHNRF